MTLFNVKVSINKTQPFKYLALFYITKRQVILHVHNTKKFIMALFHWKQGTCCDFGLPCLLNHINICDQMKKVFVLVPY